MNRLLLLAELLLFGCTRAWPDPTRAGLDLGEAPETGRANSATTTNESQDGYVTITGTRARETAPTAPAGVEADSEPTNTTPCNGYVEFCTRRYSNISVVGAHNSPFVLKNNLAANQAFNVTTQLDDGIRFLQAQIQWPTNATVPHFCHTSCDLLDAGPITAWLGQVSQWIAQHPYDVVTILLGNGNYSAPSMYAPLIESTGIVKYAYIPPHSPMGLDDWPTLEEMILHGQRVVLMLDYKADEAAYPWLLDEFTYLWETPFDPPVATDLPCTVQRPPDLEADVAGDRLYLMNHNLNVEVSLLGESILIPAISMVNQTNAVTGDYSLGAAAETCIQTWSRPPSVLDVDFYNYGTPPGSVFQVAAQLNGVVYNSTCCGEGVRSGALHTGVPLSVAALAALAAGLWLW